MARNKKYRMSLRDGPSPHRTANLVANGNTEGERGERRGDNCMQTFSDHTGGRGFWEVDLGRNYTIYNLKVFGHNGRMYIVI
jgi:hypothetical protein